ncbi:MAG: hypothetical protein GY719_35130, partial [bacterium]|nr:hypothetical protein [bacterium]
MDTHGRTLSWLHLSDLHRCPARDGGSAEVVLDRLLEDLRRLLQGAPRVDLLLFTGDAAFGQIAAQSLDDQFLAAWEWLEKARDVCGLSAERVFLVPGNHDVDRSRVKRASQSWLRRLADQDAVDQLLQQGGEEWRDFSGRLDAYREWIDAAYPHLIQDGDRLLWTHRVKIHGLRVGLAGFDSAWSCGGDDEKGRLWLGADAQLGHLLPRLADTDVRLALIHHPPSWLVEAEDPGTLRSRLQSEFQVLLHGHEHQMWVETPQTDHVKIAAGAVHDRGGHAAFGYNLTRWDLDAGIGELWLRHWEERTGEWVGDTVGSRTDERGVWSIDRLPWAPAAKADKPPPEDPEPKDDRPVLSAAERRGVFGRGKDLRKLRRALENDRLVWVHGLSGIGKSTLVAQATLETERDGRHVGVRPAMDFDEVYSLFARELGSPDPEARPMGIGGRVSFEPLKRWGRSLTRKVLLHVEGADAWLEAEAQDSRVRDLLAAIVEHLPTVAVVVESTLAPKDFLPANAKRLRLRGLRTDCLDAFFRRPLPELRPDVGWVLATEERDAVAAQVAGDRRQRGDLHPFALVLLVQVADGLGLRPPEVLERHSDRFRRRMEVDLFELLVERVLGDAERRLLRLLALYRQGVVVPKDHSDALAERLDVGAFGSLVRRSVLEQRAEGFHLHSLLRRLAHGRLDGASDEVLDDHAAIAHAWLAGVRRGRRLGLEDIAANNEAFHHLEAAQLYSKLAELQADYLRRDVARHLEAMNLRLLRRLQEHRIVVELWTRVEPDNPKPFRFLGETLVKLEGATSDAARDAFRRAVDLGPRHAHHWSGLGRCLLARDEGGTFVAEIEALDRRRRQELLRDDFVAGIYDSALEAIGRTDEAEQERQRRIDQGSRNPALYDQQADAQ